MAIVLDAAYIRGLVDAALEEDYAMEDATTDALIAPEQRGRGVILAKAPGVIAGLEFAEQAFRAVDADVKWTASATDGQAVSPGFIVATVEGALGSLVRAERTGLNLLTHLSGIATATVEVVRLLEGTECRLRDTRKTIPGLRVAEKYATQVGGAKTFRVHLADGLMAKDNHIAALRARGLEIEDAVRLARERYPELPLEVEVTTVAEAQAAMAAGAGELLLDNMTLGDMREVVAMALALDPRPLLEASGGVTPGGVREVAETGVDFVSMGWITHSAPGLDLSFGVEGI
ncbi:MAG TPA: carboxylating nicotinate-nucleotide diphosphorylase [Dehalococcoidia bacterium]|nr:carboxylating nicotinate-nucleotide diphosphorylase [Dehalococcoidia bacterium]